VARQPNVIGSPLALGPRGERAACVLEATTPAYRDLSLRRYRQAASPKAMPDEKPEVPDEHVPAQCMLVHRCGGGDQFGEYEPTNEDEVLEGATDGIEQDGAAERPRQTDGRGAEREHRGRVCRRCGSLGCGRRLTGNHDVMRARTRAWRVRRIATHDM
jgi:hypothetical protein